MCLKGYPLRGFKSIRLEFDVCQLGCETNFFLFSWKYEIDENGLLNYHATHKNYQNLLQCNQVLLIKNGPMTNLETPKYYVNY